MSQYEISEIYFIVGMMVLTFIISIAATIIFFRTLKRERSENARRANEKSVINKKTT